MPGCELFFADGELPWGVLLQLALSPHLLLALGHCIKYMLLIAAQRPQLETKQSLNVKHYYDNIIWKER